MGARRTLRRIVNPSLEQKLRRLAARFIPNRLNLLAIIYDSDKRSATNYVPVYVRHLQARRHSAVKVLEIGIGGYTNPQVGGNSLRMWRTYFPDVEVIGIDIYPKMINEPRIRFYQCDQSSRSDLEWIAALGPYDVIIDDGSHYQSHVLLSFDVLYPVLKPGGVYVIEDLQTAYSTESGGGSVGSPGTGLSLALRTQ